MANVAIDARALGVMRQSVLTVLIVTVLLATGLTFLGAKRYFGQLGAQTGADRMGLYQRALNEALRQHQHLPFVLARDQRFSSALDPHAVDPGINTALNLLAREAKLEAIYLMDVDGVVVATSNAGKPHSFLGQNYGFRPYFQHALKGNRSDYFAIGATSGRPGYFVAEPVTFAGKAQTGVIAIKLDISELQRSWETGRETVVAVNRDNIVVLSSNPDWLFRPIKDLAPAIRDSISQSRQFADQPLDPLDWQTQGPGRATVAGTGYLLASGPADWRGWTVHYLYPNALVLRQTGLATGLFGSVIAFLIGFATYLRSRRIALAFAESERQRTALSETNQKLQQAQAELAQTAQLAALGQLAASVTHELGQPITAFRNHLAAAEMSREITSPETAANLNKLVDRMDSVTRQFRYLSRARTEPKTRVLLKTVLGEVTDMLGPDYAAAGVSVKLDGVSPDLWVLANQIQLEQVFTNLLKNALHAVENVADPTIEVSVTRQRQQVRVRVCDNGPGLSGATLHDLQQPFYSTKPSGVGMGLGLAIATQIIKDHGGALTLDQVTRGAVFIVTLPLWQDKEQP